MILEAYVKPILTACIAFPFLALLILLPWLIYNYRKYGFLSTWTSLVVYSLIFYSLCAFFLVILPLPAARNNWTPDVATKVYQALVPFAFVKEVLKNDQVIWSSPGTYVYLLKDFAFLQALFNLCLFVPLGVYMRYFDKKLGLAVVTGFLVSLFYEITQRTGLFGYYKYPYRLFDVDDLIINTTGALLGFVIAPLILSLFPSAKDVKEKAHKVLAEYQVRPFARLVALYVDLTLIAVFNIFDTEVWNFIGYILVFILIPVLFKGVTPGTALMRFRLQTRAFTGFARRALVLYSTHLVYLIFDSIWKIPLNFESPFYHYQLVLGLMMMVATMVLTLGLTVHGLRVIWLKRIEHFYFDQLGQVENVRIR